MLTIVCSFSVKNRLISCTAWSVSSNLMAPHINPRWYSLFIFISLLSLCDLIRFVWRRTCCECVCVLCSKRRINAKSTCLPFPLSPSLADLVQTTHHLYVQRSECWVTNSSGLVVVASAQLYAEDCACHIHAVLFVEWIRIAIYCCWWITRWQSHYVCSPWCDGRWLSIYYNYTVCTVHWQWVRWTRNEYTVAVNWTGVFYVLPDFSWISNYPFAPTYIFQRWRKRGVYAPYITYGHRTPSAPKPLIYICI